MSKVSENLLNTLYILDLSDLVLNITFGQGVSKISEVKKLLTQLESTPTLPCPAEPPDFLISNFDL